MLEIDLRTGQHPGGTESYEDALAAENVSLRLLLAQAEINTNGLLARAGIDAKERETADKLQKLILEELHHRVKNTLATVSAIVSQSLRNVQGVDHAQRAIEGRLLALGRAHDLLLQTKWSSADLGAVVHNAIEAFDDRNESRFSISGPDVQINSGAVIVIAMTLNELCTNATKYGAFSLPKGRVDLGWTIDRKSQRLRLSWTEKDGPSVRSPAKRSFGTRLIETLGRQLLGDVQLTYAESGFAYTFDAPMTSLNAPAPA
ncbi:sensor histidine kinase [Bradyrhizobium manausense]|uniref:sensor histidine kinase n=1 Tax=Bradyrhizobium manausense TaxID=989370 RepID=UPI001BA55A00|nr:sensor histidine kinase [Bradyrhizobium manausense]MBR1091222.1 sensor histidine kinase [Bradyrhizobium manausense]